MRIAVVEDEQSHREHILQAVREWQAAWDPSGSALAFPDAKSFFFAREENLFDLLILDILMPGMSGMELAQRLREEKDRTALVFLTGESSFVFDGYKVEALDYLLKPIRTEELYKILERAEKYCRRELPRLVLESAEGVRFLALNELLYLEARNKDLNFVLHTDADRAETVVIRASLEEWIGRIREILESCAGEDFAFAQPHRSYFCSLNWVLRVEPAQIYLVNGQKIPLARARKQDFMAAYLAFCRSRGRQRR